MINIVVSLSYIFLFCSLSFAEPPTPYAKSYGAWQREQLLEKKQVKGKGVVIGNRYNFQTKKISAAEASTRITDNSTKISDLTIETKSRIDKLNQKMEEEARKDSPSEHVLNSLHDQINQEEASLGDLNVVRSTRSGEYLGEYNRGYYPPPEYGGAYYEKYNRGYNGEYNRGYYGEYNRGYRR
jgi:hypothetical protein